MGDIALRGNRLTVAKGPPGRARKRLGPPGRADRRLGIPGALGGREVPTKQALQRMLARRRDFQTHGRDVPTMAAKGGRIGLQSGGHHPENVKKWITRPGKRKPTGKPPKAGGKSIINPEWLENKAKGGRIGLKKGSVHKPGSHSYFLQEINKPRKGKAIGGVLKHAIKKLRPGGPFRPKKKVYPETEDLTHQVGPYVGDVGSEGKRRKLGPRAGKGKGRPKEGKGRPEAGPQAPSRRKALARTFKKMGRERKAKS